MKPPVIFKAKNSRSQQLANKLNAVSSMARAATPAPNGHVGINIRQTPDGWTAVVPRAKGGGGGASILPFKVDVRNAGTQDSPQWQAFVNAGRGRRSLAYDSEITIGKIESWEDITDPSKIWLQFDIDYASGNFVIDQCEVVFEEDFWDEYPLPVAFDDPETDQQTRYYLLLATFEIDDEQIKLVQEWTGNFVMKNFCFNGLPAIRPENWGG